MKSGIKTTELWVGVVVIIVSAFQKILYPDSPFPTEALVGILMWISARVGEKALSGGDPAKRAWKTSEFWVALGYSVAKYVIPDLPESLVNIVALWTYGRPMSKVLEDSGLKGILERFKR